MIIKPVADLYLITYEDGRLYKHTRDAEEASDAISFGFEVEEFVSLEKYRAAMLQGADGDSPVITDKAAMITDSREKITDKLPEGWVACSEQMPEAGDDMIVFTDDIVMSGVSYSKKKGFYLQALGYDDDEPVDNVTHWMPLPAAPQQEAE